MQAERQKKIGRLGSRLMFYWLGLMVVLLLLVVATYTWFSLSKTPRVNDMDLNVTAPAGLELALRPDAADEEWGQALNFADMVGETAPLKPCTWSQKDGCFYGAEYGVDGRMTGGWKQLSDEANANTPGAEGYYNVGTFYARSKTAVTVSLSEAVTLEDGTQSAGTYLIGTPVWNDRTILHENGGSGAEYAVRIGLRITPVDAAGQAAGPADFFIYEPNSDRHANGSEGYVPTLSCEGDGGLVPENRLITQTTSTWTEVDPVQRNATLRTMGRFTSDTKLFSLKRNEMVRIDVYLWLEGQDADCTNEIGTEAQILASLQFAGDYSGQSGLEPIR